MVVSAGIGDIVKFSFEDLSNETGLNFIPWIVSNFGIYDDKTKLLRGFQRPLIHSFNKEDVLTQKYYEQFSDVHETAIVMGDIVQDSHMLKNVPIKN